MSAKKSAKNPPASSLEKAAEAFKAAPAEAAVSPSPAKKPSGDTLEITCPCCKAILVIGIESGEVVEHRKLTDEAAAARRVEEAIDRAKHSSELAEKKFAKAQEREKSKMDRISKLFEETMKKKIEEGDTGRPASPFDME